MSGDSSFLVSLQILKNMDLAKHNSYTHYYSTPKVIVARATSWIHIQLVGMLELAYTFVNIT